MDKIIAQRLIKGHSERKIALGEFLEKKAKMLRDQRVKDGFITEKLSAKA